MMDATTGSRCEKKDREIQLGDHRREKEREEKKRMNTLFLGPKMWKNSRRTDTRKRAKPTGLDNARRKDSLRAGAKHTAIVKPTHQNSQSAAACQLSRSLAAFGRSPCQRMLPTDCPSQREHHHHLTLPAQLGSRSIGNANNHPPRPVPRRVGSRPWVPGASESPGARPRG